jgi:hypothetical protein
VQNLREDILSQRRDSIMSVPIGKIKIAFEDLISAFVGSLLCIITAD